MNKRILELATQAISIVLHGDNPDGDVGRMYIPSEFARKFAELIVKECANICFSEAQGHNMAFGEHCGVVIKEHFGVE